jgi:hypothetical protein
VAFAEDFLNVRCGGCAATLCGRPYPSSMDVATVAVSNPSQATSLNAISPGTYHYGCKERSAFHLCQFWEICKYSKYFRRRRGIKVLRMARCFVLCIVVTWEKQAAVCSKRAWRMTKGILSRQLATDSARGTPRPNGTKRACEDVICISI